MRVLTVFLALLGAVPAAHAASKKSSSPAEAEPAPQSTAAAAPSTIIRDVTAPAAARPVLADEDILPAKGDFAIGFDVAPTLTYLGSVLSDAGANGAALAAYPNGFEQMLYAKYYLSPTVAARGRVGLTFDNATAATYEKNPVQSADPDVGRADAAEIRNTVSTTDMKLLVGGGVEMRRGYRRLQGFYGGEALLGAFSSSSSSTYGWAYNEDAQDFGVIGDGTERELSSSSGLGLVVGARGFAGVEYFIFRKVSLAAEYGFGASLVTSGRGSQQVERWEVDSDGDGRKVTETNSGSGAGARIRADVDNGIDQLYSGGTGSITVLFHF